MADDETLAEAARQASIKKKENAIKASFKIGMNEEERKVRDIVGTNQYHTGNDAKPLITMDKAD